MLVMRPLRAISYRIPPDDRSISKPRWSSSERAYNTFGSPTSSNSRIESSNFTCDDVVAKKKMQETQRRVIMSQKRLQRHGMWSPGDIRGTFPGFLGGYRSWGLTDVATCFCGTSPTAVSVRALSFYWCRLTNCCLPGGTMLVLG